MAENDNKCFCFKLKHKKTPAQAAVVNALEVPLETAVHLMFDEVQAKLESKGFAISPDARKKFVHWADEHITPTAAADSTPPVSQ